MKYTKFVLVIIVVVAGSLIAGILYLNSSEVRLNKAEEFLWSLLVPEIGYPYFTITPSSTNIYIGHTNILINFVLGPETGYHHVPNQSRMQTLYTGILGISTIPFPVLKREWREEYQGYQIYYEKDGSELISNWEDYADLCGYASLHYNNAGQDSQSEEYYLKFSAMWNGTGFVDKDTVQDNRFLTYKNAMFLFITKKLQQSCSFIHEVEEAIWKAWNSETGGFHPYYTSTSISGEVHLEPTCWVLIAYNRGKHLLDN